MRAFNRQLLSGLAIIASLSACSKEEPPGLLPADFAVYVKDQTVLNRPAGGFEKKILPTRNIFKGMPGGYVACYSRIESYSVYGVGHGIFVMGQIRMPGEYAGKVFQPEGFAGKDISADPLFKDLCNAQFTSCQKQCWAGGDTGGWFGK